MYLSLTSGKSTYFIKDVRELPLHIGHGLIPGGKEKDKARQTVFLTPTNPFGNDPEEDEPHDDFHSSTEGTSRDPLGTRRKCRFFGYDYQERRIKDCKSGKRNHLQS